MVWRRRVEYVERKPCAEFGLCKVHGDESGARAHPRRRPAHRALAALGTVLEDYSDTGAGLGASHQTGWTALVAKLIQQVAEYEGSDHPPLAWDFDVPVSLLSRH
jgi:hypothetical protein